MVCRAADRLSHLCVALNLTTAAFAVLLDLPMRRALRVLKPTRCPSLKLMARVQRAFPEVSPRWLLTGEGNVLDQVLGNNMNVNYGYSFQVINQADTHELLRAQLLEKERTIQLLLTYLPSAA